jgi:hypothetical protein
MNEKLYCVVILGGEDGEPDSEQYRSEPMPIGMASGCCAPCVEVDIDGNIIGATA